MYRPGTDFASIFVWSVCLIPVSFERMYSHRATVRKTTSACGPATWLAPRRSNCSVRWALGKSVLWPGRPQLAARNLGIVNRMHPGYNQLIADWLEKDPLALVRRSMDKGAGEQTKVNVPRSFWLCMVGLVVC